MHPTHKDMPQGKQPFLSPYIVIALLENFQLPKQIIRFSLFSQVEFNMLLFTAEIIQLN